jgi:hypothetical protein
MPPAEAPTTMMFFVGTVNAANLQPIYAPTENFFEVVFREGGFKCS